MEEGREGGDRDRNCYIGWHKFPSIVPFGKILSESFLNSTNILEINLCLFWMLCWAKCGLRAAKVTD
jgi:hypothetical protein